MIITVNNRNVIAGKFKSLSFLRDHLEKIPRKEDLPFLTTPNRVVFFMLQSHNQSVSKSP